jgi:hypothetical protein
MLMRVRDLRLLLALTLVVAASASLTACVSRHRIVDDYVSVLGSDDLKGGRRPTLIFFLVDGLSVPVAQEFFESATWPEFRRFFLGTSKNFRVGRAVFPSLTHANISSIITSKDIDGHRITGNQVRLDGFTVNFEIPAYRHELDRLIRDQSIFTDLDRQGRRSLSLAPYYGDGASARYPIDLEMGLAYKRGDYAYVDGKLTGSLENLLDNTPPEAWPEFIFVHLMGIDSASHRYGRRAPQVFEHARFLDARLSPIFRRLEEVAAQGHPVGVLLTADHGMTDVTQVLSIKDAAERAVPDAVHINQGRLYSLGLREDVSDAKRARMQQELAAIAGVEAVVAVREGRLVVAAGGQEYDIRQRKEAACKAQGGFAISVEGSRFLCPLQIEALTRNFLHPYFVTSIATYFRSFQRPDFLLLARPGLSFNGDATGSHGGLSTEELQVPVLSWRMELESSEPVLRTYHLLETLRRR